MELKLGTPDFNAGEHVKETWKPSEGLKRAEAVAAQIKEELAAAGIPIAPMYQWRMAQVIGAAIDEAMGPLVPTWVKVDAPVQNGSVFVYTPAVSEALAESLTDMASEMSEDMQDTPPAGAIHAAEEPPKKRGRGRPPGPGKKKDKKAAKKAATPDAAAAAV